jgi:GNAT superfamily N-acetyltransferase
LSAVIAYAGNSIEFTWSPAGRAETLLNLIVQVRHRIKALSFLPIMEAENFNWGQTLRLPPRGRFFRALHSGARTGEANLPRRFVFSSFDPADDLQAVADLLGKRRSETAIRFDPQRLRNLIASDDFYPAGWVLVRDRVSDLPIGLAINGYCPEFEEGYVDWIQVLPELQRCGVGAALLHESIRRLGHARFVTISGSLDPPHAAGELYARCGFGQTRRWTVWGQPDPNQEQ